MRLARDFADGVFATAVTGVFFRLRSGGMRLLLLLLRLRSLLSLGDVHAEAQ